MTEFDDQPPVSIQDVYNWMISMFAAIGMFACAGIVGLWFGGFFHYLAQKFPEGFIAWIVGVVS